MTALLVRFLMASPRVYDMLQRLMGCRTNIKTLQPHLAEASTRCVLDIGAGTGNCIDALPEGARYIWLDRDINKLADFRTKQAAPLAVIGDVAHLPLRSNSVDYAVSMQVSHHLSDDALTSFFREAARVTRMQWIYLDATIDFPSLFNRLLWYLDQGSYPRTTAVLLQGMQAYFEIETVRHYKTIHSYVLCVGRPKS